MNDLKQFQNGVNEDGEVVIPFIGGLTYPVRQIDGHIKGFLWLTFVAALFNVVISSFLGRNFLCGLGIEGPGFYCSANVLALGGSVLAFIGGLAWYINRWYSISESGGEIVYKLNLKDVKTVGFILFYLGLWAVAGWAAYSLNIRKPVEDWREELLFFFVFTMIILAVFATLALVKSHIKVLSTLLTLVIAGAVTLSFVAFNYDSLQLSPLVWLFIQSLCLYFSYLSFQTIFFDRFIACFRIRGNVGFFIAMVDSIGYTGTVLVLVFKECFNPNLDWLEFYNTMAGTVGIVCCTAFTVSLFYLMQRYRKGKRKEIREKATSCPVPSLASSY